MNYDKIIVELLGRIQTLEEQMKLLMEKEGASAPCEKVSTPQIREYIEGLKAEAKSNGNQTLILKAGDVHRALKLKSAMPMVCNAMRQCMGISDTVLHQTSSGYSSTLQIEYEL